MAFNLLPLIVFVQPLLASPLAKPMLAQSQVDNHVAGSGWSKEAILALIGVCAAIICFIVGLAWPRIQTSFHNMVRNLRARRRVAEEARRYNDWLEFNEWRDSRRSRG